jgi:ATP synthase protein I
MRKVLFFQLLMLILIVILAGVVGGMAAAISALLGGLSYLLPSAVMGLVVWLIQGQEKGFKQAQIGFIIGQSLKIFLALLMLGASVLCYSGLMGIWFMIGLICVSKFIYLVIWKFGHYGSRYRK